MRTTKEVREAVVRAVSQHTTETEMHVDGIIKELNCFLGDAVHTMDGEEFGEWIMDICDNIFYEVTMTVERDNGTVDTF